jgi:hypothetical protein
LANGGEIDLIIVMRVAHVLALAGAEVVLLLVALEARQARA